MAFLLAKQPEISRAAEDLNFNRIIREGNKFTHEEAREFYDRICRGED
jgi:hypothetical protein